MLLQAESVTSCAAVRRMAVTDGSCSLPGINNRLLGFKYIMSASSAVMEKVQLGSLQSDWWLAACRVRSFLAPGARLGASPGQPYNMGGHCGVEPRSLRYARYARIWTTYLSKAL